MSLAYYVIFDSYNFVVCLILLFLLIILLWSRTRRMKLQGIYARDLNSMVHMKSVKTIVLFLLFLSIP